MGIAQTARQFFEACEPGEGWDACQRLCHPGATFSAQAHALDGVMFDGDRIRQMTKIWNDGISRQQLGWA
jgi:hypothetical protein